MKACYLRESGLETLEVQRIGRHLVNMGAHYEDRRSWCVAADRAKPKVKAGIFGA